MKSGQKVYIVYAVNDAPHYRSMMDLSIRSWKRFHPDWQLEVITLPSTNTVLDTTRWHFGSRVEAMVGRALRAVSGQVANRNTAFAEKMEVFMKLKYERTLFMDCDTYVLRPLDDLAALIDAGSDVVAQRAGREVYHFGEHQFSKINSGVFFGSIRLFQTMMAYVHQCPISLTDHAESDQYFFSYCLHVAPELKISYVDNLQVPNSILPPKLFGADQVYEAVKKIADNPVRPGVFHYIFQKRKFFDALLKLEGKL